MPRILKIEKLGAVITAKGQREPVHDPGRLGRFGRDWIRKFFA